LKQLTLINLITFRNKARYHLLSITAIPDKTFKEIRVQLSTYHGPRTYIFTQRNWPILGGSLPASLIDFVFQDSSRLMYSTTAQVKFVVNYSAKSGIVIFKNYREMHLSKAPDIFVDRGPVEGSIRWNCP
jgi:hypothetical protein